MHPLPRMGLTKERKPPWFAMVLTYYTTVPMEGNMPKYRGPLVQHEDDWRDIEQGYNVVVVWAYAGRNDTMYNTSVPISQIRFEYGLEKEHYAKEMFPGTRKAPMGRTLYAIRVKPKPPIVFRYGG